MMFWKTMAVVSVLVGVVSSWVIGVVLRTLGLRHSGGHALAEVAAIGAVTFIVIAVAKVMAGGRAELRARVTEALHAAKHGRALPGHPSKGAKADEQKQPADTR